MTTFCNNNKMLPLRIEVNHFSNSGDPEMYGSIDLTAKHIEMRATGEKLPIMNKKGKPVGHIAFN